MPKYNFGNTSSATPKRVLTAYDYNCSGSWSIGAAGIGWRHVGGRLRINLRA
jgi:hypothetical protein